MPVETLRPSDGRLAGGPFTSAMPFRILNKGPDYFRRAPAPGARKLSAVERLEADKAKYVKSQQVARTRQEPVKPPIIRKPLLSPGMLLQCRIDAPPARKVPRRPVEGVGASGPGTRRGPALNLEILNNLINVCDGPPPSPSPSPSGSSPSSGAGSAGGVTPPQEPPCGRLASSPAEPGRRPPPVPARAPRPPPPGAPSSAAVRRVDVRPQSQPKPRRAPPQVAMPQVPPPAPLGLPASPMLLRAGARPPASPAFTRLSSASSRGSRPGSARRHPALHRSKSDLSDRYSRATADLERFFNYCGLGPGEVEGLGGAERFARATSDIVSVSKLRSASTPSSEEGREGGRGRAEEEEDGGTARPSERVPYGISVIERNARVIKWLYGIRQARDTSHSVSNV